MDFAKALTLYRNDKTLQILRAESFPLLVSFFHLAFKQQDRIYYSQQELKNLLGDYLYRLQQLDINDYTNDPVDYLQQWAKAGYLRRYYDTGDEPVYELTPAAENALKWLEDLNKQQFVGTHSRLIQLFNLLKQIVAKTETNYERVQRLEAERAILDIEIENAKKGIYDRPDDRRIKEDYLLAEETARRLLADFRQVEQNFRELDRDTRQAIIKTSLAKGKLLDEIFERQDFLWSTDQGKSFKAFWQFLMSSSMQEELEQLIAKINLLPAIRSLSHDLTIDRLKTNLVDAGDKVNRTNDGLLEQLRKFVEQKSLLDSKRILHSIEEIESLLLELKDDLDPQEPLLEIGSVFRPIFLMERPLFTPPVKLVFKQADIAEGASDAQTEVLFEQFFIDIEQLATNVNQLLKHASQVSLEDVITRYKPTKGVAEVLGYMQVAVRGEKHHVYHEKSSRFLIENIDKGRQFTIEMPTVIFNR